MVVKEYLLMKCHLTDRERTVKKALLSFWSIYHLLIFCRILVRDSYSFFCIFLMLFSNSVSTLHCLTDFFVINECLHALYLDCREFNSILMNVKMLRKSSSKMLRRSWSTRSNCYKKRRPVLMRHPSVLS